MSMKKLLAFLLALVMSVSALAGCGASAAEQRRQAAKEIFGITDQEYKRNSEYYDALMTDYSDFIGYEPDYETEAGYIGGEGIGSSNNTMDPYGLVLNGVSLDVAQARLGDFWAAGTFAVKKGDLFYAYDWDNEDEDGDGSIYTKCGGFGDVYGKYRCRLISDTTWQYPVFSRSEGDQVVEFSKYGSFDALYLYSVEKAYNGFPVIFHYDSQKDNTNLDTVDEDYMNQISADGNYSELDGFEVKNVMIDGVPLLASPRLVFLEENKGRQVYGLKGERDEVLKLSYNWYDTLYERQFYCNAEFIEVKDKINFDALPTVDGYSPIALSLEPGLYEMEGFLLQVVD